MGKISLLTNVIARFCTQNRSKLIIPNKIASRPNRHRPILLLISNLAMTCCVILAFYSCDEPPVPKPMGYFHIEIPAKNEYQHFSSACPFEFDISTLAKMQLTDSIAQPCFYNLEYPQWKATIHISYIPLKNDLKQLIDEEHHRKEKHLALAASITDSSFIFPNKKVSATVFNINGTKTATPLQFFVTDSTKHFFRASLYFYHTPNNDSIQPVIKYIKEDVRRLIKSFEWK